MTLDRTAILEDVDDLVQQLMESFPILGYRWSHRDADHRTKMMVIECGTAGRKLVVHIERNDGGLAQVNQLGRQV